MLGGFVKIKVLLRLNILSKVLSENVRCNLAPLLRQHDWQGQFSPKMTL